MPRLIDSQSNPVDFCKRCYPSERTAIRLYGDIGEAMDERGNCFLYDDDEHPPFEDGDIYWCEKCGKKLTANDNGYN